MILGVLLGGLSVFVAVKTFIENISAQKTSPLLWGGSGGEEFGQAPKKSKSPIISVCRPLLHRLIIPITSKYKLEEYKKNLKREINSAGLGQELNEEEYVALQLFLGIMLPVILMAFNFLFNLNYPFLFILFFGVVGFVFPYFFVKGFKNERRAQVLVDLPFVIDLLSLSTEAGLDFIAAIERVVNKMNGGALSEELAQVLRDLKLGSSRSEALNAMAWRMNMSEVSSFIAVLTTADTLGASIGNVLRQQSEQMRQERFVRAEKAGAEASQKIYLPLIMFILPAVLIMVFGPVILQFMGGK
ncbi:MAG: type II secretion system F family protein [Oligoflexia bacterium]|nr:type II secretion system F family protein [Oligoflexia bacterium]